MDLLSSTLLVFLSFHGAKSTFSPSGSVSIDCGGQQTFTCTVAANGPASWAITGLQEIVASGTNGIVAANNNARISSAESTPGLTSTITITGFTTADNGGTVRCDDQLQAEEGSATVVVVPTTLANATAVMANVDQCSATLTWSEPSDSSVNTSVSCTPSSPQCSSCTSSGCTIGGLNSSTSYTFSVTRSRSGCDDSTAVSSAVMSGGIPSCSTNARVADRSSDFSSATITWDQPSNSPPVTSYNVTCNSSCTAMPCSSGSSTCRALSVSPCEDYSVTVLTMNSCGSSTGCTENVIPVPSQGPPQCGTVGMVIGNDSCPSFTFMSGSIMPSTVVISYQLVGDPSSAGSLNCDFPINSQMCRLTTLPMGNYTFTFTPSNSCGSPPNACTSSSNTLALASDCNIAVDDSADDEDDFKAIFGGAGGGIAGGALIGALAYGITIVIMRYTCYSYLGFLALLMCQCCPCCKGKARKSSSKQRMRSESPVTPPAQPPAQPPADEYANPQAIRDRKERGKEDKDKIQYAAIDFSAGAGSGAGEVKIHQKEEPVIYTTVQHV